jgi:hypothetical protein
MGTIVGNGGKEKAVPWAIVCNAFGVWQRFARLAAVTIAKAAFLTAFGVAKT